MIIIILQSAITRLYYGSEYQSGLSENLLKNLCFIKQESLVVWRLITTTTIKT